MLHGGDLVVANSSFEDNLAERAGILNVEGSYCRVILDGVRMSRHAAARGSEVEVRGAGGWVVVAESCDGRDSSTTKNHLLSIADLRTVRMQRNVNNGNDESHREKIT